MHIAICLDDRDGLLFNNRRLSSDRAVISRLAQRGQGDLWVSPYSAGLFEAVSVRVEEHFLELAGDEDLCFAETSEVFEWLAKAKTITVFRWNRKYPSDVKLPAGALAVRNLVSREDFLGNSHDLITEEVYV